MSWAISFNCAGKIVAVHEKVPVEAILLRPRLHPIRRFVEQCGAAVVEPIVAVAGQGAGIGHRDHAAVVHGAGHAAQVLGVLIARLPGMFARLVAPRDSQVVFGEGPRAELVRNGHLLGRKGQPTVLFRGFGSNSREIGSPHDSYARFIHEIGLRRVFHPHQAGREHLKTHIAFDDRCRGVRGECLIGRKTRCQQGCGK